MQTFAKSSNYCCKNIVKPLGSICSNLWNSVQNGVKYNVFINNFLLCIILYSYLNNYIELVSFNSENFLTQQIIIGCKFCTSYLYTILVELIVIFYTK